eukprot:10961834-Lingulodinium_polyedra.AAC.1
MRGFSVDDVADNAALSSCTRAVTSSPLAPMRRAFPRGSARRASPRESATSSVSTRDPADASSSTELI